MIGIREEVEWELEWQAEWEVEWEVDWEVDWELEWRICGAGVHAGGGAEVKRKGRWLGLLSGYV